MRVSVGFFPPGTPVTPQFKDKQVRLIGEREQEKNKIRDNRKNKK